MPLPVSLTTGAIMGILLVVLGLRISLLRVRHKVSLGDGGNKDLARCIRLHANNAEWAPLFLVLCLCAELASGSGRVLIALAAVFVISRLLLSWGMWTRAFSRARQIGAMGTYLACLGLSIWLLFIAMGAAPA